MGAPAGWHSCVQLALVLWNPEDPTQYIYHHSHYRFTSEKEDWGFKRFYYLNKLFTPCKNRIRALIENDSTNIMAFVRVFKDPTGVLWLSINYDSKKDVGLKNKDATGYLNSLLQFFYCITYFRKAIYQIPAEDEITESFPLELQRVFIIYRYQMLQLVHFEHHDVREFNGISQDNLEAKIKGTKVDGVYTKLFAGKMKNASTWIMTFMSDESSHRNDDMLIICQSFPKRE